MQFTKTKHEYLIQTWIRFTVVNRTLTSLHVGAFEITLTVPLSANKNKSRKSNCKKNNVIGHRCLQHETWKLRDLILILKY